MIERKNERKEKAKNQAAAMLVAIKRKAIINHCLVVIHHGGYSVNCMHHKIKIDYIDAL